MTKAAAPSTPITEDSGRLRTALDERGEVLHVSGELDVATVPQFDAAVQLLLAAHRDRLVVRMADVTFIDSSGLGALLRAHRMSDAFDAPLVIQDPNRRI